MGQEEGQTAHPPSHALILDQQRVPCHHPTAQTGWSQSQVMLGLWVQCSSLAAPFKRQHPEAA